MIHHNVKDIRPVMQADRTGCGIAAAATILGQSYLEVKISAAAMGIDVSDPRLWSDTQYVRRLLAEGGAVTSESEVAFQGWEMLPNVALLAINPYQENETEFWHWVVFMRLSGKEVIIDSSPALATNLRTDFDLIKPKWFIEVKC